MNVGKALLPLALALLTSAASAEERTLRYTDHEPLGGMRTRFINEVFFPAIEKESHGRLKIEAHWGGELSTSYDALRKVAKENAADMAIVVPEYAPAELPLHQIFKSVPIGPTGDRQISFFRQVYAEVPAFPVELEKANLVNLLFCGGYPLAFYSANPLASLEDIRGQKWRTASFWHQDFLRNAGAVPVTMPWNDGIYKALQDGALDGLVVNVDSGFELKVHKVAPNILLSRSLWLGHVYLLAMNRDTWNTLAQEDRDAIRRAAETAYKTMGATMDASFETQIADLQKEGAKVRVLSLQELNAWKTAVDYRKAQAYWAKAQEAKGVKDVAVTVQKVTAIIEE